MKRNRTALVASLLAMVAATVAGCGGVSGRGSASPATFFLPGLMKVEPRPSVPPGPGEAGPAMPVPTGISIVG